MFFLVVLEKSQYSNHESQMTETKVNAKDDSKTIELSTFKNNDTVYLKYFCCKDEVYVLRSKDVTLFNDTIFKVLNEYRKLIYYLNIVNLCIRNAYVESFVLLKWLFNMLCCLFLAKTKSNFDVGDIVKVVLNSNSRISDYRAKILEVGINSIKVQSIDFGCYDSVQRSNIYELSDHLQKVCWVV